MALIVVLLAIGTDFNTDADITQWTNQNERPAAYLAGVTHAIPRTNRGFGANGNDLDLTRREPNITWTSRYQLISAANGVIEDVQALPDSEFATGRKAEILAEAQFLRAYGHFSLLSYFGEYYNSSSDVGIIIRDRFTASTDIVKARSSVADCYAFIFEDLDAAIADLPETNAKFYANVWAGKLLKARVLLYKGDYADAKDLALDVINNGSYSLDNMQALFQTNGINSSEVILGIAPQPNQVSHFNAYYVHPSGAPSAEDMADNNLTDLLQGDPRESWMLSPPLLPFFPWDGLRLTKYGGSVIEDAYALRLTEAYLIAAEGYAREGNDPMARTYLKDVLTQAGITDFTAVDTATGDALLFEIYAEYVKNMCVEDGHEWFALQRCLPFSQVQTLRPGIDAMTEYIMPIPEIELTRNSAIDQNPGYQGI